MSVNSPNKTYELVIGLEVHVQLNTRSKAFCRDENRFGAPPNTLVSPVSLAMPGTLPRINREHVHRAILLGLALDCRLADRLTFDRKHYFYPDLPKGYQISQHNLPLCREGRLTLRTETGPKEIGIRQIHLEEDAGKSLHESGADHSRIDLNRAGAPLLEIVTRPDLRSAAEVDALMSEMRRLVRWLGISDGHMEQGSLRCDCNISVRPRGADWLGARCEVKNLNSMRYARQAIAYERKRQVALLEKGETVQQETRQFDPASGTTRPMRDKEDAQDYRYLPEPDLPVLPVDAGWVSAIAEQMPELPQARFERLQREFGLTEYQADLLTESREVSDYFLELAAQSTVHQRLANLVINQIMPWAREQQAGPSDFPVHRSALLELVQLIEEEKVSHSAAFQQLLPALLDRPDRPVVDLAEDLGLFQLSDTDELAAVVREVLSENPKKVTTYRKGKKGLLGFFMGQVMRKTGGQADPQKSKQLLTEELEKA